jgi:Prion-inhibition and propagation
MEAAAALSVATGIFGLLPLCASGFKVIKGVLEEDKSLHDLATQFLVEETRYLAFKKQLELHGVPEVDILEALKKRAPEIQHATILRYLAQTSNTFADAKGLQTYGLRLIFNSLDVRILQRLLL